MKVQVNIDLPNFNEEGSMVGVIQGVFDDYLAQWHEPEFSMLYGAVVSDLNPVSAFDPYKEYQEGEVVLFDGKKYQAIHGCNTKGRYDLTPETDEFHWEAV